MRSHPKNSWIKNSRVARTLIFLFRHRIPLLSRFCMHFLGCDIATAAYIRSERNYYAFD